MSFCRRTLSPGNFKRTIPVAEHSGRRYASRQYSQSTSHQPASEQEEPASKMNDTSMIKQESPAESTVRAGLDYSVARDYRTSTFSPVPKRVMDGSEAGPTVAAAVLSGAPIELQARTVRIYKPTKTATQSGTWASGMWRMDWDILSKGHRWENHLIGWQSSADFMQGTNLTFETKEDAIRFANKQGYEYFVQEPNERKFVPKAYANNFLHSSTRLKVIPTK